MSRCFQPSVLKSQIEEERYPPSIRCYVEYTKPKEELTGTGWWTISFPSVDAEFTYRISTGWCYVDNACKQGCVSYFYLMILLKTCVMQVSCFVMICT